MRGVNSKEKTISRCEVERLTPSAAPSPPFQDSVKKRRSGVNPEEIHAFRSGSRRVDISQKSL
ncbi:MAG: hypothetical protein A2W09_07340 [Deltaproteobacteria bacterium RBG_16_50_11]|nr:MAG: hypothetical protein A2W09_07340 [Deltaproteobacteria bacterium RBG_16_50_11]